MARRELLAGAAVLAVAPAPAALAFDVLRDNKQIGTHKIIWRREDDRLTAFVVVEIVVKLGFIPLYRYKHSVKEVWRGDRFISLDSQTDDNGTDHRVHAESIETGVIVEASGSPRAILPAQAIPLTHWNRLCMERPLFNPQDGAPFTYKIHPPVEETVLLGDGRQIKASRYALTGKDALDDWYDQENIWSALRTVARDGSTILYRRQN